MNATIRQILLLLAAAGLGYWAHSTHTVQAQARSEPTDLRYQFSGFSPDSALSLYNPADQSIYVYQNAAAGFSSVQCTYRFHIPRPGAAIEPTNCPIGTYRP